MTRFEQASDDLQKTALGIADDVRALPAELIHWHPRPEVWSVMDILAHIVEFLPYWTSEVQKMLADPTQLWGRDHTNAARLKAVEDTTGQDLTATLQQMEAAAHSAAGTLAALPDEALTTEAPSRNPRWGVKPVSFVVDHLLVKHVVNHRGQIQRNVQDYAAAQTALSSNN